MHSRPKVRSSAGGLRSESPALAHAPSAANPFVWGLTTAVFVRQGLVEVAAQVTADGTVECWGLAIRVPYLLCHSAVYMSHWD